MADEMVRHRFVDPIGQRPVTLVIKLPEPSFWDGTIGVEHPRCGTLADVSPELDAYYCRICQWNGRISGAWAVDMAMEAMEAAAHSDGTAPE